MAKFKKISNYVDIEERSILEYEINTQVKQLTAFRKPCTLNFQRHVPSFSKLPEKASHDKVTHLRVCWGLRSHSREIATAGILRRNYRPPQACARTPGWQEYNGEHKSWHAGLLQQADGRGAAARLWRPVQTQQNEAWGKKAQKANRVKMQENERVGGFGRSTETCTQVV